LIGGIGWAISVQMKGFANDLPGYQSNIRKRVADLQVGKDTPLDRIRATFEQLIGEMDTNAAPAEQASKPKPVLVTVQGGRFSSGLWQMVLPLLESMFRILLVGMLVIFMLLERDELRKRVIRLLGYGRLSLTTQALDEAGKRVSRYLFAQFIVNAGLGGAIGLGLFLLGVPYALLWGCLIVILRFIPYFGSFITMLLAFAVSLATSANWWQPVSVLALFAVLESVVAMVIEPMLFSQNAGTLKLVLLIAMAFWTWLWGPVGLLLATPLTACLAVVAKYVPQLEFIAVLFGDEPMMQASVTYYRRLLAQDQDEAEAIVEEQLETHPVGHVFDEMLVPALHYAKRDRRLGTLTDDEQAFVYKTTRQIVERIGLPSAYPLPSRAAPAIAVGDPVAVSAAKVRILAWPAHDEGDAIALLMLQQLLNPTRYEMEISAVGRRLSEILQEVEQKSPELFCVGCIPPGGVSASRHLSKLLRGRLPDLSIVVGYWGLPEKGQNDCETLLAAGATQCTATLSETRDEFARAMQPHVKLQPVPV
jgi:predicted PurR-regulated permease PerM